MPTTKEFISHQNYCYGYNVDESAAVEYLLENHAEWRKSYSLFGNHWAAMTIVAKDLSKACGLHVYADRIWIGGGCIGLGMVFAGLEMGVDRRTPENARKLGKLEQNLKDLKLVADPKLDILCSCSYPPHFEEPFHIGLLPPKDILRADRVVELTDHWRNQSEPGKGGAKCICADDVDLNGEDGERD